MLTNENLLVERRHPPSGVQRLYLFPDGVHGLSCVNSPALNAFPYAWEIAVVKFSNTDPLNLYFRFHYREDASDCIQVFSTDDEANAFITRMAEEFK